VCEIARPRLELVRGQAENRALDQRGVRDREATALLGDRVQQRDDHAGHRERGTVVVLRPEARDNRVAGELLAQPSEHPGDGLGGAVRGRDEDHLVATGQGRADRLGLLLPIGREPVRGRIAPGVTTEFEGPQLRVPPEAVRVACRDP